jgi:hypothetical protein
MMHTKFLLFCFESMSGLRINFQKSDVLVVGGSEEDQNWAASVFNCNIGQLPFKYLGVMVNNRHMSVTDLAYVYQKVEKKLLPGRVRGYPQGENLFLFSPVLVQSPTTPWECIHYKKKSIRKWTPLGPTSSGMDHI